MTGRSHRVLVVDDHPDTAAVMCMMLRALGYECWGATDGRSALAIAREVDPAIALLDIGMAEMSGYELARELREKCGDSIYLAALTGWGAAADRTRAIEAGFDVHISKPADRGMLESVVRAASARLG